VPVSNRHRDTTTRRYCPICDVSQMVLGPLPGCKPSDASVHLLCIDAVNVRHYSKDIDFLTPKGNHTHLRYNLTTPPLARRRSQVREKWEWIVNSRFQEKHLVHCTTVQDAHVFQLIEGVRELCLFRLSYQKLRALSI
jgi:hypothetical protein